MATPAGDYRLSLRVSAGTWPHARQVLALGGRSETFHSAPVALPSGPGRRSCCVSTDCRDWPCFAACAPSFDEGIAGTGGQAHGLSLRPRLAAETGRHFEVASSRRAERARTLTAIPPMTTEATPPSARRVCSPRFTRRLRPRPLNPASACADSHRPTRRPPTSFGCLRPSTSRREFMNHAD